MRKYELVNGNGEVLDLTTQAIFLHNVSSLGFDINENYRSIGDRYIRVNAKAKQKSLTGTITFNNGVYREGQEITPYMAFQEFCAFANYEPLVLNYYIPEISEEPYKREVSISKLDKTEYTKYGTLDCSVTFVCHEPWYKSIVEKNFIPTELTNGWKWNESSNWSMVWADIDGMGVSFDPVAGKDSPCRIVIFGPLMNPSWTHSIPNKTISQGKVNVTIPDGCALVVDNSKDSYEIKIYNVNTDPETGEQSLGSVNYDAYKFSDFSTTRFVTLKKNERNYIRFSSPSSNKTKIMVEAKVRYDAV